VSGSGWGVKGLWFFWVGPGGVFLVFFWAVVFFGRGFLVFGFGGFFFFAPFSREVPTGPLHASRLSLLEPGEKFFFCFPVFCMPSCGAFTR